MSSPTVLETTRSNTKTPTASSRPWTWTRTIFRRPVPRLSLLKSPSAAKGGSWAGGRGRHDSVESGRSVGPAGLRLLPDGPQVRGAFRLGSQTSYLDPVA